MTKIRRIIIFFVITAVQIIAMICWAGQKSNYYIDELYSLGYAQSFTYQWWYPRYITETEDWQYETWLSNETLKAQLETSPEEGVLTVPLPDALPLIWITRIYFGLLNIFMSVFSPDKLSAIPGAALNLFLFFFIQLLLYQITREITGSNLTSFLVIIMYGFSSIAADITLYIRFYTFIAFLFLWALRLHQIMWRAESSLLKCELLTVPSMILILIAFKHSELILVLGGALILSFTLGLLFRKYYAKAAAYVLTIGPAGLYYIWKKTGLLQIIFHPENYTGKSGPEGILTRRLFKFSLPRLVDQADFYFRLFGKRLFGSNYILLGFVILLLALLIIRLAKRNIQFRVTDRMSFVSVLFFTSFIYLVFAFLTYLDIWRYISFLFPLAAVLFWTFFDFLLRDMRFRKQLFLLGMLMLCVGLYAGETGKSENIEYLYTADKPFVEKLQNTGIQDAVIINLKGDRHTPYDCISLMPEDANIYVVNDEHYRMDPSDFPDEVLLWINRSQGKMMRTYAEDLLSGGYEIKFLGNDHVSNVYTLVYSGN